MSNLIAVDIETTGLDPFVHVVIEVAAVNVATGETLHFVPYLPGEDLARASAEALQLNRYFERGVAVDALPIAETQARYARLWQMLKGNRFGAANARFDAEMLRYGYARAQNPRPGGYSSSYNPPPADEPWHYRLADLSSYAAGVLGIHPAEIPSMKDICEAVGVVNTDVHSALADARAAAECFRQLDQLAMSRAMANEKKESASARA